MLLLAACHDGPARNATLIASYPAEPGACPVEGTILAYGLDDDDDGVLDVPEEVDDSHALCDPSAIAVRTTSLPPSTQCPGGGTRIEAGIDDGAGGAIAHDGVLDNGEVDSTSVVCDEVTWSDFDLTEPEGPQGIETVSLSGGNASLGVGGDSGRVGLLGEGSSVLISRTGRADTSFTTKSVALELGSAPLVITEDTTIIPVPVVDQRQPNTAYSQAGQLVVWTGAVLMKVTGLRVAAGVQLTMHAGNLALVSMNVDQDVELLGTITTARTPNNDRPSLQITCRNFSAGADAHILLAGGGQSGSLKIAASNLLTTRAKIHTAASEGRAGGSVELDGIDVYNYGDIDVSGGSSTTAAGGASGSVTLHSFFGSLLNAGEITLVGGTGLTRGGNGGTLKLLATSSVDDTAGPTVNRGAWALRGGDVLPSCVVAAPILCTAGHGGDATMTSQGGRVRSDARLDLRGGTSVTGPGGEGGTLRLGTLLSTHAPRHSLIADVELSGTIDLRGGDGTVGGQGGDALVSDVHPYGGLVRWLGYATFEGNGGDGVTEGGSGGGIEYDALASPDFDVTRRVHIYSDLALDGGDATSPANGTGGEGGKVWLTTRTSDPEDTLQTGDDIVLAGAIAARSGRGVFPGEVGEIKLEARSGVLMSGDVDLSGGTNTGSLGNEGGRVLVSVSQGGFRCLSHLTLRGGGGQTGGIGGYVQALALATDIRGRIDVRGGDGVNGGAGGLVDLRSIAASTSLEMMPLITGGIGTSAAGAIGGLKVDLIVVAGNYPVSTP